MAPSKRSLLFAKPEKLFYPPVLINLEHFQCIKNHSLLDYIILGICT